MIIEGSSQSLSILGKSVCLSMSPQHVVLSRTSAQMTCAGASNKNQNITLNKLNHLSVCGWRDGSTLPCVSTPVEVGAIEALDNSLL